MQNALAALEQTYMNLNGQVTTLSATCTPQQKATLISQVVAARTAYWACVNKAFHDDDPKVVSLTNQLTAANQQVASSVSQMADIANILTQITQAVSLASSLATLVIAA